MTMTSNVVKFPYTACRRVHSRKPRRSFNGTPEERAAKAAAEAAALPEPANVIEISRPIVTAAPDEQPDEQLDLWSEVGRLLRKLNDQKLLPAGLECWRLLLERHGTAS